MICQMCDSTMEKKKQHFYGGKLNSNIHYECQKCQTSCVEHIRLGMSVRELWHYEFNKTVKDWEIEK